MTREYGQYCGLAHALDLIGGRWTLMIVRELLIDPKRFTELEQALPGIPTNILSARLRELEDTGLVQRSLLPRPASGIVYELTSYGKELEEPLMRLGLWGAKSLGPPAEGDFISCSALMLALRAEFHPEKARGRDLRTELRLGDEVLRVVVRQGELSFTVEPFAEPHLTLEAAPHLFVQVFTGYATLDDAVASGQMQVDGSLEDARSFFEIFQMAVPAEAAR